MGSCSITPTSPTTKAMGNLNFYIKPLTIEHVVVLFYFT